MIRVLVWGMTSNLGGIETFLISYFSNIPKDKIHFDFISPNKSIAFEDEIIKRGSKIYYLPSRKHHYFAYRKQIKRIMRLHACEYDAVWLNDCLFGNTDILKLSKKLGIKKRIAHAHNSLNRESFFQRIRHKMAYIKLKKYATDFWACSDQAAKWTYSKSIYENEKIQIIKNAIDTEKFCFNESIREKIRKDMNLKDLVVYGFVGRIDYQKNLEFAIEVFNELYILKKNAIFLVVGDGSDKEKVKQLVYDFKLHEQVQFLGIRDDIYELLQAMDVLLMPSRFEGFGIVAIEAQATGILTVISDAISQEARVADNTITLSLNISPQIWANKILDKRKAFIRTDCSDQIKKAGYDINIATKDFVGYFIADEER